MLQVCFPQWGFAHECTKIYEPFRIDLLTHLCPHTVCKHLSRLPAV